MDFQSFPNEIESAIVDDWWRDAWGYASDDPEAGEGQAVVVSVMSEPHHNALMISAVQMVERECMERWVGLGRLDDTQFLYLCWTACAHLKSVSMFETADALVPIYDALINRKIDEIGVFTGILKSDSSELLAAFQALRSYLESINVRSSKGA